MNRQYRVYITIARAKAVRSLNSAIASLRQTPREIVKESALFGVSGALLMMAGSLGLICCMSHDLALCIGSSILAALMAALVIFIFVKLRLLQLSTEFRSEAVTVMFILFVKSDSRNLKPQGRNF